MCLAVPGRILKLLSPQEALADLGGIEKAVSARLVPDLAPGDWVIVHAGFALQRIDEARARETLALLSEAASPAPHEKEGLP